MRITDLEVTPLGNTYGVFSAVVTVELCATGAANTVTGRPCIALTVVPLLGTIEVARAVSGVVP